MVDEKVILQVLAEQQEYVQSYDPQKWVGRYEETDRFECFFHK